MNSHSHGCKKRRSVTADGQRRERDSPRGSRALHQEIAEKMEVMLIEIVERAQEDVKMKIAIDNLLKINGQIKSSG